MRKEISRALSLLFVSNPVSPSDSSEHLGSSMDNPKANIPHRQLFHAADYSW